MAKILQFKRSNDFYKDLAMQESSGRLMEINEQNYIGLYQMGEMALVDAGYYSEKPLKPGQKSGSQYNNDWTGGWTGKNGIYNKEEFLASRLVQDIAVREYHQKIWSYIKAYRKYEGQDKGGITLTKSGMLAAGHLVGHGGLKTFIDSNGQKDPVDGNKVPCSEYLKGFSGYAVDYSISKLMAELEASHKKSAREEDNVGLQQSDADSEGEFGGSFAANKAINAQVNQLLSSPDQLKDYQYETLSEAMEGLKSVDNMIPGFSQQSLAFAKENQEFMQQLMGAGRLNSREQDFTDLAGITPDAIYQNRVLEEDPEFYASLGIIPDFDNLQKQHTDLVGDLGNNNQFKGSWQNEEQENCLIC
jgi:hypothetical protein